MKSAFKKYVVMSAIFGFAIFAGQAINARMPEPDFIIDVNPVENEIFPGSNRLELIFKSAVELGDVVLKVKTVGPIVYTGVTEREIQVHRADSLSYPLEVEIPANDTSGLEISIELKGHRITGTGIFFISLKSPIEVRKDDPFRMAEIERSVKINSNPYKGKKLPYGPGHPAPPPKMTVHTPSDEEKMHQMEREPLTDADVQHIEVDGEIWMRNRGEYKFKKLEQLSHEQYYQKLMDKYGDSTSFRVIVDLRDGADYTFVSQMTHDEFQTTDSAGFYETILTKRQLWEVHKKGIHFENLGSADTNDTINEDADSEKPLDIDSGGPARHERNKTDVLDTLWNFNFDPVWQNSWIRYDDYPVAGEDYWDDCYQTYVPAHSGSHMVWCAGYGDMQCGTHYDVDMLAWLKTASATYIGDHENVKLRFWVWFETEYQWDYLSVQYSFDNSSWYCFYSYPYLSGSSGGWRLEELDIPPDHDSLYIGFEFSSDFDGNARGAFLDDICLIGTPNMPGPNLTYSTPSGWDYPIVPSSDTGTNTVGPLLGNAPTYVDFAVKNAGVVESGPFLVAFYIDNQVDTTFQFESIQPGQESSIEDYEALIDGGAHTLEIFIDSGNVVYEENEIDNLYEHEFNWGGPGTITVTGTVKYYDLNYTPPILRNSRNVRIQLWDDDDVYDDSLAAGWTEADGSFQLGPVSNEDDLWSGRQDIYLKIFAENDAAYLDNSHNGDCFRFQSSVVSEVPDGIYNWGDVGDGIANCGPLYIIDMAKYARDKWIAWNQPDPGTIEIILADSGTYFMPFVLGGMIQIDSTHTGTYPDVFDKDIIFHEYAHWIERQNYFFDDFQGGTHGWCSKLTVELAATEGFANFWASVVANNTSIYNYYSSFQDYYYYDVENGEKGWNGVPSTSCNDYGDTCEASVAGMLWDLFDDVDDDYSYWSGTPGVGYQDGVADIFDSGLYAILDCVIQRTYAGHRPDQIQEFWNVWFNNPTLGNNEKLWAVWYEHGTDNDHVPPTGQIYINGGNDWTTSLIETLDINAVDTLSGMAPPRAKMRFSNDGSAWSSWENYSIQKTGWDLSAYGGNSSYGTKTVFGQVWDVAYNLSGIFSGTIEYVECLPGDANGDNAIGMGDIVYLMNFIFKGGPPPIPYPLANGDADGNCACNIGDPMTILDYTFKGGPPPVDCDTWIANCGRPIRQ